MAFMPEFKEARNFPSSADNLPEVAFAEWAGLGFASLDPAASFDEVFGDGRTQTRAGGQFDGPQEVRLGLGRLAD